MLRLFDLWYKGCLIFTQIKHEAFETEELKNNNN